MAFHEVRFPAGISLGASGGPERRTEIVVLGSGHEERNSRWADSKRSWNAGYGVKRVDDLYAVIAFFEERRGRFHGFRFKDWSDFKSCAPEATVSPLDQEIGEGTGTLAAFQLKKTYGSAFAPWTRDIKKPVSGSVVVAVDGVTKTQGSHYTIDDATGIVTFTGGNIPGAGTVVTAGFEFDVPARFDTDKLEVNLSFIEAGSIPNIPIVEIRL
jgi:uncharacterized protein (TIGR02217 family)